MSPDSARFLLSLLDSQQLHVGAPDFEEVVARIIAARAELRAVLDPH